MELPTPVSIMFSRNIRLTIKRTAHLDSEKIVTSSVYDLIWIPNVNKTINVSVPVNFKIKNQFPPFR